jgi:hypothetical protein
MADCSFATLATAQALTATDTLTVDEGSGNTSAGFYVPASGGSPDQINLMTGGRSVTFSAVRGGR